MAHATRPYPQVRPRPQKLGFFLRQTYCLMWPYASFSRKLSANTSQASARSSQCNLEAVSLVNSDWREHFSARARYSANSMGSPCADNYQPVGITMVPFPKNSSSRRTPLSDSHIFLLLRPRSRGRGRWRAQPSARDRWGLFCLLAKGPTRQLLRNCHPPQPSAEVEKTAVCPASQEKREKICAYESGEYGRNNLVWKWFTT